MSAMKAVDGNEAAASVAHRLSEVIAIYPITPSSNMGEWADEWSAKGKTNIWGNVPQVVEMQSEAGAIGAVHGALQAGTLSTTFTASQGLLLMVPNMFKIAGELTSFCMHVAARSVATHALSIFGDHSDVMACRQTGFSMLSSCNVQEAHDCAAIGLMATLKSRVPMLHFFDGFRTSHEVQKISMLSDDELRSLIDDELIVAHRQRALNPDRPVIRGTAQNPDVFFQAREACNPFFTAVPGIVQEAMDRFGKLTGRQYKLAEYVGHPQAERIIILMGSGAETVEETVKYLAAKGEKVGSIRLRLYRPFPAEAILAALPKSVKRLAVLERTKEAGALGEPLYLDVLAMLLEAKQAGKLPTEMPMVVGGRYGLSSKEFTPAMVKAVYDELQAAQPKPHFTVGITDDVTHLSLKVDESFDIESPQTARAVFFGLGADGTVGANKNSIKIIGEDTDNFAQGYFVYDSKKSGAMTISHLRFGPQPIRSPYLIKRANFVACHQFVFLEKQDVLSCAMPGAVFLLNAPFPTEKVWDELPREVQQEIIDKKLKFYVIDAAKVAQETGMGTRINTIMQTCFFAISGVLPREQAIVHIKEAIKKTYAKRGEEVIKKNYAAVDGTLANLHEVKVPASVTATHVRPPTVSKLAPDFVQRVTAVIMAGRGDQLPVSAFPPDGTWPTGTTKWEKREIGLEIPLWEPSLCIQCNKCSLVCPHAAIRSKAYDAKCLEGAPASYRSVDYKAPDLRGMKFTIQVAPDDCTGCNLCVMVCPAKDKANPKLKAINMTPVAQVRTPERENYDFFLKIPDLDRTKLTRMDAKTSQLLQPLFEYSGACGGCGETPYVKLLTQLFGDRLIVANATGCSSIYSGNLPTTPYAQNCDGRGPAWSNSLFEDNAEFGLGMCLSVMHQKKQAEQLLTGLNGKLGDNLVTSLMQADQSNEAGIIAQRERVAALKKALAGLNVPPAARLNTLADYLVKKSVWILGGDGWAYDIGYGGLDHVLSLPFDLNVLILDTEVYSNTGGQASKSTPLGAAAKFAAAGKSVYKKDIGLMAMSYGSVYVGSIAFGANDNHTVKTFVEAESYSGPSLLIAYSHCIAHGYDLKMGLEQQKLAVNSGVWPLYRFDPRRGLAGEPSLQIDSQPGKATVKEYMRNETRFRMVEKIDPQRFNALSELAVKHAAQRVAMYQQLAQLKFPDKAQSVPEPQGQKEETE